jgi:hypothetical protein
VSNWRERVERVLNLSNTLTDTSQFIRLNCITINKPGFRESVAPQKASERSADAEIARFRTKIENPGKSELKFVSKNHFHNVSIE